MSKCCSLLCINYPVVSKDLYYQTRNPVHSLHVNKTSNPKLLAVTGSLECCFSSECFSSFKINIQYQLTGLLKLLQLMISELFTWRKQNALITSTCLMIDEDLFSVRIVYLTY